MAIVVTLKGIEPKLLNSKALRDELIKAVKAEGKIHKRELGKPVATWNDAPKMESTFTDGGTFLSVFTGPTGSDLAVNKFTWLDKGTRIRWALMSQDWKSKTKPGSFSSGGGRGRVVIAGRRAMSRRGIRARPGIAARGWTEQLQKQRRKPFTNAMVKAIQTGAKKVYR